MPFQARVRKTDLGPVRLYRLIRTLQPRPLPRSLQGIPRCLSAAAFGGWIRWRSCAARPLPAAEAWSAWLPSPVSSLGASDLTSWCFAARCPPMQHAWAAHQPAGMRCSRRSGRGMGACVLHTCWWAARLRRQAAQPQHGVWWLPAGGRQPHGARGVQWPAGLRLAGFPRFGLTAATCPLTLRPQSTRRSSS